MVFFQYIALIGLISIVTAVVALVVDLIFESLDTDRGNGGDSHRPPRIPVPPDLLTGPHNDCPPRPEEFQKLTDIKKPEPA
jgi:hypothetical protein